MLNNINTDWLTEWEYLVPHTKARHARNEMSEQSEEELMKG